MKRKILPVAMAVVMTVVCLAGCSGNFTKASFINAAKKCGMEKLDENMSLNEIMLNEEESHAVYYVEKDQDRMNLLITQYAPVAEVKEFVQAVETIGKSDDNKTCLTNVYYLTAVDSENAKEIYESLIITYDNPENGEKDGVTYTICYFGPEDSPNANDQFTGEIAYGVYLKGNKIIWIRSYFDSTLENNCVEDFCKSLGLVSPYTLK